MSGLYFSLSLETIHKPIPVLLAIPIEFFVAKSMEVHIKQRNERSIEESAPPLRDNSATAQK